MSSSATAQDLFTENASLTTGLVHAAQDEAYMIAGPMGMVRAQRAAGCLLVPAKGDKVLVALCGQQAFVLSLLVRSSEHEQRDLTLPGGTVITTTGQAGLTIQSSLLQLSSPDLRMEGERVTLVAKTYVQRLGMLFTSAVNILTLAVKLTTHASKCIGFFDNRTQTVHDSDTLKAGRIRVQADTLYRLRAERADLRSERELIMDSERINIG